MASHDSPTSSGTAKALIGVGIGVASVIALVAIVAVVRMLSHGVSIIDEAVIEAREPTWNPDPALVEQLLPEEVVGCYAIRPIPKQQRGDTEARPQDRLWIHPWNHENGLVPQSIFLQQVAPANTGVRDPRDLQSTVETRMHDMLAGSSFRSQFFANRPPANVVGEPVADFGRIGSLRFIRWSFQSDYPGTISGGPLVLSTYNRIWLCHEENRTIWIHISAKEPFDRPIWQLIETSVRTLRKLPGEHDLGAATFPSRKRRPSENERRERNKP